MAVCLLTKALPVLWLLVSWELYKQLDYLSPEKSWTITLTSCSLKKVLPVVFLYPEEVLTPHSLFYILLANCLLSFDHCLKTEPILTNVEVKLQTNHSFSFSEFSSISHPILLWPHYHPHSRYSLFFFFKVAFEFRPAPVATKHLQRDSNSAVHQSMLASSVSRKRNPCFANESGNCSAHALFRSVVVLGANVKPGKRLASQTAGTEAWDTHTQLRTSLEMKPGSPRKSPST